MTFTQAELDALKEAYASGALRISHEGKSVEYASEEDLLRRIRVIQAEMAAASGTTRSTRSRLRFSRD